jgi:aminocarboxymuconate-semialdehyde decarboxylase
MLINLHAHELTYGMFDHDPYWGPAWVNNTLKIGDWSLGNTNKNQPHPAEYFSLEAQRKRMVDRGIDKLVLSQPAHMFMYWADDFGTRFSRIVNDELSQFVAQDPEHFDFWALVPMADPDPAVAPVELERAVTELGAVGMMTGGVNFAGREIHDEAFYPLWEKMIELQVPAFVHGYNASASGHGAEDQFDTSSIIGMNNFETICIWNLICGGVLDRYPELRFYVTHAGGFFPYHLGRFEQTNQTMAPDSVNEKPVSEYLDNFVFDPDLHEPIMRKALVDFIGIDRFVYGDNLGGSDNFHGDLTDDIGLTDADREKIRSTNALRILPRLSVPASA